MIKMTKLNRLKNIKIMQSIIIMWVISLLTTIIIGVVGYVNTSKMYATIDNMNSNVLPKLKDWGDVNGDMGVLRNTLTKIIDRPFDEENEETMLKLNKDITTIIARNESISQNDKKEAELVSQMKKAYEHYYSFIPNIIEQRKQNIILDKAITNVAMGKYGNNLAKKNIELVDYQKQVAGNQSKNSKRLYHNNMIMFITIFIISILILTSISIVIILIIKSSIKEFINKLYILSDGDFTVNFDTNLTNEFGVMNNALSKTINSISNIISIIKNDSVNVTNQSISLTKVSEEMHSYIEEVSSSISNVAQGSSNQAKELSTISTNLNSFGEKLDIITKSINTIDENTKEINSKAKEGNQNLDDTGSCISEVSTAYSEVSEKINALTASVDEITKTTDLINSISEQTNLIALNAAIEAARAGEAGKEFSIVASEIRSLAEQSQNSSKNINDLLKIISNGVNSAVIAVDNANQKFENQINIVNCTMKSFKDIANFLEEMMPQIQEIHESILQINNGKNQIISSVKNSSILAEENSASSEEISSSAEEMSVSSNEVGNSAELLKNAVQKILKRVEKFTV